MSRRAHWATREKGLGALLTVLLFALAIAALAGCGDGDSEGTAATSTPRGFPDAGGRQLEQIAGQEAGGITDDRFVPSPAGRVFRPGENRFAFGMFTVDREQIDEADVAVYAAPGPGGKARGPYPARLESLETAGPFASKTSSGDPDAITRVYVSDLELPRRGEWRLLALVREGGALTAARMPSIEVRDYGAIPAVGDRAPRVHTPTVEDVGQITEIETRIPPDTMHEVDLADAIGKRPVVLLFSTPALCESRVCGPVVDVAEQVKSEFDPEQVAFIHMEVYRDNQVDRGLRPQLRAFGLPTEPWLFVIDREGRVATAIEGGFSVDELDRAVRKVAG